MTKKEALGAAPSSADIKWARPIVLAALGFGNVPDSKKLADLGFDGASLAGFAAGVKQHGGGDFNPPAFAACDDVMCLIRVVATHA